MTINIIKATPDHASTIYEIEAEAFSDPWSKYSIVREIMDPHSVFIAATDEAGKLLGYVSMRHIVNEGHICNIAVAKAHRRQGIGDMLISALIHEARRREMIGLTLEVRKSNKTAIALYEKHDFAEEGIRKNYYSNPKEDAIIMWLYFEVDI